MERDGREEGWKGREGGEVREGGGRDIGRVILYAGRTH